MKLELSAMNKLDEMSIYEMISSNPENHTFPQSVYNSQAAFDFDMKAVYFRSWLQAGAACEIPKSGDYLTVSIGESSIIIIRAADGRIAAYHNTCRHRGALLLDKDKGNSRRLVCPYHQWTYGLDGKLLFAKSMQDSFCKETHSLKPVHCKVVSGVIFICIDDNPPDFEQFSQDLSQYLDFHKLNDCKVAYEATVVEYANWKLVLENGRECYHCDARHPELLTAFRDPTAEDYFGQIPAWLSAFNDTCAENGVVVGQKEGVWYDMMRFPLAEGYESLTTDGKHACAKFLNQASTSNIGSFRWACEPNSFSHALLDYAFTFEVWPVSPMVTHVKVKWLVHKDAVEGVDYSLEHLRELWEKTNDQDKWLAENNQAGVNSIGYGPGPYSEIDEPKVIDFVTWYRDMCDSYVAQLASKRVPALEQ